MDFEEGIQVFVFLFKSIISAVVTLSTFSLTSDYECPFTGPSRSAMGSGSLLYSRGIPSSVIFKIISPSPMIFLMARNASRDKQLCLQLNFPVDVLRKTRKKFFRLQFFLY